MSGRWARAVAMTGLGALGGCIRDAALFAEGPLADTSAGDTSGDASTDTSGGVASGCGAAQGGVAFCPAPRTTWHFQLQESLDRSLAVEMYMVDLFDVPQSDIATLRAAGHAVVCWFAAGTYEAWRPDADAFPDAAIGEPLAGWPDEYWLDVRDADVRAALALRMDLAREKGCDGIDPANVDGYAEPTGFAVTAADQLEFNRWLAREGHARGLSVGLSGDLAQIPELVDDFDWATNASCFDFDECDELGRFIDAGKAVFHVEYVQDEADGEALADALCPEATARELSTLVKRPELGAWTVRCE